MQDVARIRRPAEQLVIWVRHDSSAADHDAFAEWGIYTFLGNPYAFTLLSPVPVVLNEHQMEIGNDLPFDELFVWGAPDLPNGLQLSVMYLWILDWAGMAFDSDALAISSIEKAVLDTLYAKFRLAAWSPGGPDRAIEGRLQSFTIEPSASVVPEPATLLLLGAGLLGITRLRGLRRGRHALRGSGASCRMMA